MYSSLYNIRPWSLLWPMQPHTYTSHTTAAVCAQSLILVVTLECACIYRILYNCTCFVTIAATLITCIQLYYYNVIILYKKHDMYTRDVFEWKLASYVWLVMKWGLPSSSGRSVSMSQPVSVTNRVCSNWAERRPSWGREGGGQLPGETLATIIIWMTGRSCSLMTVYTLYTATPSPPSLPLN